MSEAHYIAWHAQGYLLGYVYKNKSHSFVFFSFLKLYWTQTVETFWILDKIFIINNIQTGKDPKFYYHDIS